MRPAVLLLPFLALLVDAEYRYKLRGPPHPTLHYGGSPFLTKGKWPAPRPLLRAPIVHHHPPPRLHHLTAPQLMRVPLAGPGPIRGYPLPQLHKVPVIPLSWDSSPALHTFTTTVHKEHFNPPAPQPEFEFHVAKPAPDPQPALVLPNAHDDDKGPIHTIPAPNLSLLDKPYEVNTDSHSSSYAKPPEHSLPIVHNFDTSSFQTGFSSSGHATQPIHAHFESLVTPVIPLPRGQGYEVHEPSNDQTGYTLDGRPAYYAPDPDPSLPAPKIPATTDPHSLPSNGKVPADLLQSKPVNEELEVNSLTSQDLLQLLQGLPVQSQLLDQHYLTHGGHEQFQQGGISHGENSLSLKTIHDDFQPQFHNFNYQHQYEAHGDISRDSLTGHGGYPEQDGSESMTSIAIANRPSGTEEKHAAVYSDEYDSNSRNSNIIQGSYANSQSEIESDQEEKFEEENSNSYTVSPSFYSQIGKGGSGIVSTSFYTTLPNRQAAETLASLATAGSQSHQTTIVPPSTEAATEESDDDWVPHASSRQEDVLQPESNSSPAVAETVEYVEYDDAGADVAYEDEKQDEEEDEAAIVNSNLQFGARIRPKRKAV